MKIGKSFFGTMPVLTIVQKLLRTLMIQELSILEVYKQIEFT